MNPNLFRSHVQCKSRPSHSNKKGKKKLNILSISLKKKSPPYTYNSMFKLCKIDLVSLRDSILCRCVAHTSPDLVRIHPWLLSSVQVFSLSVYLSFHVNVQGVLTTENAFDCS